MGMRPSATFLSRFTRVFPSPRTPWLAGGRMTPDVEGYIRWDSAAGASPLRVCTETTRDGTAICDSCEAILPYVFRLFAPFSSTEMRRSTAVITVLGKEWSVDLRFMVIPFVFVCGRIEVCGRAVGLPIPRDCTNTGKAVSLLPLHVFPALWGRAEKSKVPAGISS